MHGQASAPTACRRIDRATWILYASHGAHTTPQSQWGADHLCDSRPKVSPTHTATSHL